MAEEELSEKVIGSPDDVWALISDPTKYPSFFKLGDKVHGSGHLDGASSELEMRLGIGIPVKLRVVESREAHRLVVRSYYGMRLLVDWRLEQSDKETDVTLRIDYVTPYSVKGEVLPEDHVRTQLLGGMKQSLAALKAVVESQGGRTPRPT